MKNIKYLIICACIALFAGACTPMDDNYKGFVEDGPVTYITKLKVEEVTITGERYRVHVTLPPLYDLRAKNVEVYWANKTRDTIHPINPGGETSFVINNLTEGTYIFEFILTDNDGNKSLTTPVTAEVYGDVYEGYLMNRAIMNYKKDTITFAEVKEPTMLYTIIEWSEGGVEKQAIRDTLRTELILPDFNISSFRYRTAYQPGKADTFYSPYSYMLVNPNADDVSYDRATKHFSFPDLSNDDHWIGFEMKWVDRHTLEYQSFKIENRNNSFDIPDYASAEFTYTTLFKYKEYNKELEVMQDLTIPTTPGNKPTSIRAFLNRTNWFVALETEKATGRELNNVMDGSWTAAATAISAKNKSPYLSQKLPWSNAATATGSDGLNSPRAHIDGDTKTYLSMIKGPGTSFETGEGQHTNGGVSSQDADFGNEIYFIIDLGQEEEFDYFSILYRIIGTAGNTLRPQGLILFGSNDPDCITDQTKWTPITEKITPPNCTLATEANNATHASNTTGNIAIPFSSYRYVKCRYTDWSSSSQSMQITEFYLGGTQY
jgi:hypothetical protein